MPTLLPTDDNNNPIPALRLKDGGAHSIVASSASVRNSSAIGAGTQIVSLYATVPVFVRFGGATVTAATTDHFFPAGLYYDFAIGGDGQSQMTHVAIVRADGTDGVVYMSEKL